MLAALRSATGNRSQHHRGRRADTTCTMLGTVRVARRDVQEDEARPSQVSVQEPTHLPDALVEEVDVALRAHEHEAKHSGTEVTSM